MNHRPVVALALAETVSLLGTRLSMIAIPWLVLTTTGDALLTGVIGVAEMLPYVLAKALGGPLIDRLGTRRVAIAGDLASMAAIALVPLLHLGGGLHFATLLPVVVVFGALRGPADAAKQAMVPAVAALAGVPLERVTGVVGTIDRLAGALGAAAAGALVALFGAAPALLLTVVACGLAALIVAFGLRLSGIAPVAGAERAAKPSYFAELGEGWRSFRTDPVLVGIVGMVALTNLFDQAYLAVLLPVWVTMVGDASLLGALLATFSVGAILGSSMATWLAPRLPRLAVYATAYMVCGAPRYLVFVFDTPFLGIFAMLATAGFASGFINPIISAVMFERIAPALVGRVNSLIGALCWILIPFGGLVGGALTAGFGLTAAFAISAAAYFAATILPLALPSFRALAHRPQAVATRP